MSTGQPDERAREYPGIIAEMAEERRRGQPLNQQQREAVRHLQHAAAADAAKKRQAQEGQS